MLFLAYLGSWWSYYPNIILVVSHGFTSHVSMVKYPISSPVYCKSVLPSPRLFTTQGKEVISLLLLMWSYMIHIWFIYDSYMIPIWSGIWKPRSAKTPRSLIASTWAIQGHWSTTVIRGMPHRMEQNGHASTIKMYIIQYQHLLWGRETLQQMEMNFDISQY